MTAKPAFDADEVNGGAKPDRLGFAPVAAKLASAIMDQASAGGLAIGIEGKWGSGKSSLISRTKEHLAAHALAPKVLDFAPWIIASKDALIEALIKDIKSAIEEIEEERGKKKSANKKIQDAKEKASDLIDKYSNSISTVGKIAKVASSVVPGVGAIGAAAEMLTSNSATEIKKQKEAVSSALRQLTRRIVVVIDDVDRLEPAEMIEVLRLVRAVADFPNVIYLISYDRDVVTEAISNSLNIKDGFDYLEKFIQVSFRVPLPQAFELRSWLRDEVTSLFSKQLAVATASDQRNIGRHLSQFIDELGGRYLKTPRDVVRTANALKLYGAPVADEIYVPDLVWLQLIRVHDPKLYDWIEGYVTGAASVAMGAMVKTTATQTALSELEKTLAESKWPFEDALSHLHYVLPGIAHEMNYSAKKMEWKLFKGLSAEGLRRYISVRRLGSPNHFRLYLALVRPEGYLTEEDTWHLLSCAKRSREEVTSELTKLSNTRLQTGASSLDQALSMIMSVNVGDLSNETVANLIFAMADTIDQGSRAEGDGFGLDWPAIRAERLFRILFGQLSEAKRKEVLEVIFANGKALGWLAGLLADDIYDRGFAGENKHNSERFFSDEEFQLAREHFTERLRASDADEILTVPKLPSILYAWRYLEGAEPVRKWCAEQTEDASALLSFLTKLRGWTASDDVYHPLNKATVSEFLNYEAVRARVQRIAAEGDGTDKSLAKELETAFKQGEKDW